MYNFNRTDQRQLLQEAITGDDFSVESWCFANGTANDFHGNAVPGWWEAGDDGGRMELTSPFLDIISLSELLIAKLSAKRLNTKTGGSEHINKHSEPINRRDTTNVCFP